MGPACSSAHNSNNGTKIKLHFGAVVLPAVVYDNVAGKELLDRLPYTIHASRYDFDICGIPSKPFPRVKEELVTGWHNGDISFDGTYFTILFGHESESASYGQYANMGAMTCDLAQLEALRGSFDILIEFA